MTPRLFTLFLLLVPLLVQADEGMWMLGNLNRDTRRAMRRMGLELTAKQLYNPKGNSLKDAVVSFGGFCSGVVVSREGLVLTNHHCGFSSVQQHSTVEHDYLRDGFVATNREAELPCPELYVRFLLRQEDVTQRVLKALGPDMDEARRSSVIDSMALLIGAEASRADTTLVGVVDAYYGGTEFWLSVYQDYNDVRLVLAPPSSIGKFGWDKDNWMWPRHTGDFCMFRIYADRDNRPAEYSPDNVPYRPKRVAPISLEGYREGSFCMTLGYPGTTERYLSSFGIEEMIHGNNQAQIDIRGVKQAIWKREMNRRDSIRIKYASKYDESSNYWKNSMGVNQAVQRLHVLDKKRAMEREMRQWIARQYEAETTRRGQASPQVADMLHLFADLELNYRLRSEADRARAYFAEAFLNGPELVQQALTILNFDYEGDKKTVIAGLKAIADTYANLDVEIDKEVFAALLHEYRRQVKAEFLPDFYQAIDTLYGGDYRAYADTLYAHTQLATPRGLQRFLSNDSTYQMLDDPAIGLSIDIITKLFEMNIAMQEPTAAIDRGERLYCQAVRGMYADRNLYPDANSTLRLSIGTVGGYSPADGIDYQYYTTSAGVLEKARAFAHEPDFAVQPEYLDLLRKRDFGRFSDEDGEMRVCFISNNDITGGNSGSAMFNARGELLGLAFDGNWEAMSGDLLFEPRTQRTIGVDIRYILFVIEQYGQARHLIKELDIVRPI